MQLSYQACEVLGTVRLLSSIWSQTQIEAASCALVQRQLADQQPKSDGSEATSKQLRSEMQDLAKHVSSTDGELSRIREMAEQLEACVLDDLRDLGARLETADASGAGRHAAAAQPGAQAAVPPVQPDGAQLQAFMEKRLRRVEVTMAGECARCTAHWQELADLQAP